MWRFASVAAAGGKRAAARSASETKRSNAGSVEIGDASDRSRRDPSAASDGNSRAPESVEAARVGLGLGGRGSGVTDVGVGPADASGLGGALGDAVGEADVATTSLGGGSGDDPGSEPPSIL